VDILKTAAVVAAGLIALAGCQPATYDSAADEALVGEISKAWTAGYNAGDADAVANLYTEDAVVMPPGTPSLVGREAIRNFIASDAAASKAAGLTFNVSSSSMGVTPDLAWEHGTFTITDVSGATVDAGKYLSIFQKKDGKWMLYRDTWNSDMAPAPAPATEPAAAS